MKTREQIIAEAHAKAREHIRWADELQRDAADRAQRVEIPDAMTKWRNDADARAEEKRRADLERRAEERRARQEWVESRAVTELRAEIAALRELIPQGDAEVINIISEALLPLFDTIADKMQSAVAKIGERVDRQLDEMREEVRTAAKRERSGEVLDLPSWRDGLRKIN